MFVFKVERVDSIRTYLKIKLELEFSHFARAFSGLNLLWIEIKVIELFQLYFGTKVDDEWLEIELK